MLGRVVMAFDSDRVHQYTREELSRSRELDFKAI